MNEDLSKQHVAYLTQCGWGMRVIPDPATVQWFMEVMADRIDGRTPQDRSVLNAISAHHNGYRSDGRPHLFDPLKKA